MKVVFTGPSLRRLHEIQAYIAYDNAHAAMRVTDRIFYVAEMLGDFPMLGAPWGGGRTRALLVSGLPYRIHYDIVGDTVRILMIVHTSQKPPRF